MPVYKWTFPEHDNLGYTRFVVLTEVLVGIEGFWDMTSGECFLICQRITVPSSSKNPAVVDRTVILQNIRNRPSSDSVTSQKAWILLKCHMQVFKLHCVSSSTVCLWAWPPGRC